MKNSEESAFPLMAHDGNGFYLGLTKREYFAIKAMQGILAGDTGSPFEVADRAIVMADELLELLDSKATK